MCNDTLYARKDFIRMVPGFFALTRIMSSEETEIKRKRKLAFSTIGCPDWSLEEIINYAHKNGYGGIEFRGIQRELDLTKVPDFKTPERIASSKAKMQSGPLEFVALGSSCRLHEKALPAREKQLDEAKRFIDLAASLSCPYVRVFPDKLPGEQEKQETLDIISNALLELGQYARGTEVKVLLETHGDVVLINDLLYIMKAAAHPSTGLLWDFFNMWVKTGERPVDAYQSLSPYIRHVQIKDGNKKENEFQLTLTGHGNSPLTEALTALGKGGYNGYYSLEWEKLWHPDLPGPEIAFSQYSEYMKKGVK